MSVSLFVGVVVVGETRRTRVGDDGGGGDDGGDGGGGDVGGRGGKSGVVSLVGHGDGLGVMWHASRGEVSITGAKLLPTTVLAMSGSVSLRATVWPPSKNCGCGRAGVSRGGEDERGRREARWRLQLDGLG